MKLKLIGSTREIDSTSEIMKIFNNIMNTMNTRFNLENKLKLLASTSETDTTQELMNLYNQIFDAIGSLIPFDYKLESTTEIDSNQEYMNVLNRIISTLQGLGNISDLLYHHC